ncbi:VWA domain-containing protein [Natribaculum luteum]|uniref:VWA domain-containing protein n=1 Tax=Natribaculum luteum TaxID=1586232 RepID=A0ABD5P0S2_9EURY|nr:VWA domain-containing protein [Natribaculum luteum]
MKSKSNFFAISFAVLLIFSLVAMPINAGYAAGAPGSRDVPEHITTGIYQQGNGPPDQQGNPSGHHSDQPLNVDEIDIQPPKIDYEANSTVELHQLAIETLDEVGVSGDDTEEIARAINASAASYRQGIYVESRTSFDHKIDAQKSLSTLVTEHDVNDTAINTTSEIILDSGNLTARLLTRTAANALEANEDAFDNPGQRKSTERKLENAIDALERGDEALTDTPPRRGPPRDDLSSTIQSRENALNQYRIAAKHAIQALERVEGATNPELFVTRGQAYREDGEVHVPIFVELIDARTFLYEDASVTITAENGSDRTADPIDLRTSYDNASVASGGTSLDLGADPGNVTVTVEATSVSDTHRSVAETIEISIDENELPTKPPEPGEFREIEVTNDESGVTVETGGEGIQERDIHITNHQVPPELDDVRIGPVVRIQNRAEINEATVTIPLLDDVQEDENVSIYTWDPASERGWKRVDTQIDPETGTATATVDSFSFFSVFRVDEWEDFRTATITLEDHHFAEEPKEGTGIGAVDLMLVIDESGSMSGSRIKNARKASKRFVGALLEDDRAGLAGYASGSRLIHELTDDTEQLNTSIDSISAGGSTNTGAGLNTALTELEENGNDDRKQVIILLSDGHTNIGPDPVGVAEKAAKQNIEISTVGLGSGADENELQTIASTTGGDYYHVTNSNDLPDTFQRIAENQSEVALTDSNNDGIPDAVADADPPMPTYGPLDYVYDKRGLRDADPGIKIDPVLTDTSGDGLKDNETIDVEYQIFEENNETKLSARVTSAKAHPAYYDTDGDGVSDHDEVDIWDSNPYLQDTSGDGLIDSVDPAPNEETLPPEFEYQTWDINDLTMFPTTVRTTRDDLLVVARPTGAADEIEEIRIHQYVDTWVPLIDTGWRKKTYRGDSLTDLEDEDGVYVNAAFGDETGQITPEQVKITITDDDGNRAAVSHDVDRGVAEATAGVAETTTAAAPLAVGALARPEYAGATTVTTVSASTAAVALGGAAVAGTGFALMAETSGSADGEFAREEYIQPVPVTEPLQTWTGSELEILLPNGAEYSEYDPYGNRGHGWEQIRRLPGITDVNDVDETFNLPGGTQTVGDYEIVIGDTGENEVILWIYEGVALFAEQTVEEEEVSEEISEEVNEEREEEVSEEEIEETIQDGPDEVLEDPRYKYEIYKLAEKGIHFVIRKAGGEIVDYTVEQIREDTPRCALEEGDVDMSVQSTKHGEFVAAPSGYKAFHGIYEETTNPVETELRCVDNRQAVVQTYADDPADITDGSIGENISVELIKERGLDLEWPEEGFKEGDESEIGPDIIAYDDGEWLIIEAKTTTSTKAVGKNLLDTDAYDGDAQLHNDWIRNSLEKLEDEDRIDPELVDQIDTAIATNNVTKEIVLVRDVEGASHRTLRKPRNNDTDISLEDVAGVDRVTIVELAATE